MKLLSLGTAYVDINAIGFPFTDGLFAEKEIKGHEYLLEPGGSALNFARACAALELETIFIGKTGDDHLARLLETLCKEQNITPDFIKSPDVQTAIGINLTNRDGLSLISGVGTANESIAIHEVEERVTRHLDEVDSIYLGGCFKLKSLNPAYEQIIKQAREKHVLVLLDHGRIHNRVSEQEKDTMKKLIFMADYYFPSRDELLQLWEAESITEAIKKIQTNTQVKIIVKDSIAGSFAYVDAKESHMPIFPVDVKNTVGAGDAFNAGFIKGLSLNLPVEECLRYGNAVAALKISKTGVPTLAQVEALLLKSMHG